MSRKPYQRYSKAFKLEAIRLAEETDKSVTQVARELGIRVNQIYNWKQQLESKGESASGTHLSIPTVKSLRLSARAGYDLLNS